MNSGVKVVKRVRAESSPSVPISAEDVSTKSREHEIAKRVRSWIAEREAQKLLSDLRHWDILAKFAQ